MSLEAGLKDIESVFLRNGVELAINERDSNRLRTFLTMDLNNISVVIPTRNCEFLKKVLDKIENFFEEIIVAGESSIDFSIYKNVKFYPNYNANASTNRNYGSEKSTKEYLFFLDSDCEPTNDLINELSSIILSENKIITGHYAQDNNSNLISNSVSKFIKFRLNNQNSNCVKFSSSHFIIKKHFLKNW